MFIPGMSGLALLSGGVCVLTYIGSASSIADATTYDFGNFTAASAGLMIVTANAQGLTGTTTDTISIGGSNGTVHLGTYGAAGMGSRRVAAGAHNVTVTFGAERQRAGCGVWLLTGNLSDAPYDTVENFQTSVTSVQAILDVLKDGVVLFTGTHAVAEGTAWSAATERYDSNPEGTMQMTGADATISASTTRTETMSWTTSANGTVGACSWR